MSFSKFIAVAFAFLLSPWLHAEPLSLAKADFSREMTLPAGYEELIGGAGDQLYFSTKEGAVAVSNLEGKTALLLQGKDADGELVLKKPISAIAGNGVIYVLDAVLNQVVMFDLGGRYQGYFGAGKGGFLSRSSGVDFGKVKALALHEGIVYVLDGGKRSIQMFGQNGVYLGAFELKPRSAGEVKKGEEQLHLLKEPIDLQMDARGQLYVLDAADDSLLKVYSLQGEFIRCLPENGKQIAFTLSPDGIYSVQGSKMFIQKMDFSDKPVYRFGSKGKDRAQFLDINKVLALNERQIVVGDREKKTLSFFVADTGVAQEVIPRPATRRFVQWREGFPANLSKLVSDGGNLIYGIDLEDGAVVRLKNGVVDARFKPKDVTPVAVALDKSGTLWILDDKKARVIALDSGGNLTKSFGSGGSGAGQFDSPVDMKIALSGRIYVADKGSDKVQLFNSEGIFVNELVKLNRPVDISVSPQETLFVLEKDKISVYSPQLELLGSIKREQENAQAKLDDPKALLATSDELMVLDGHHVKVFTHQGQFVRSFGVKGKNRGEFYDPVSIAAKDALTFYISERETRRIQRFETQYKPAPPKPLVASGEVHSISLRWANPALPYIKRYVIYRADSENGHFVRLATSEGSEYLDRDLAGDVSYFYRVAAETPAGYEGASSTAVHAVAQKFVPPKLTDIKVEATPWQLKMSWKPLDSEYLGSYRIYQKEEEAFTLLGETTLPSFAKGGLTPNTKYTFYVAAFSKDGIESEKTAVSAPTAVFNKAPLEIEILKLRNIFSNSYKIYEQDGVGLVRLTNNTDKLMEGVKLSFMLKDVMDYATETEVNQLPPGQSVEISLKAVFNNNILTVTEDASVQTTVEASYFDNGKREALSKNPTISIYEKHKLLWDERERYATFITPKDPPLVEFSRSVVSQYKDVKDPAQLASLLFNALSVLGLTYVQDPTNPYQMMSGNVNLVDYIQFPRETLQRKSGDCDDLTAVYSALLESVGIETRVVEVPGHMFMMFSTDIRVDERESHSEDLELYVFHEGRLWIPVEATLLGSSFIKAWERGAENYAQWVGKGLTILDVHRAWGIYKPASLPDSRERIFEVNKAAIEQKFPNEFMSMLKISSAIKTRAFRKAIQANTNDFDAYLQIGIVMAKMGDYEESLKNFDKVLEIQPQNASALNNKGNVFMIQDKYVEARDSYRKAAQASPDDPYVWINLAKAYRATKNAGDAKKAFERALKLDAEIGKKYKTLKMELANTL